MKKKLKFNSRAIHGGQILDPAYGSVMTPIYQTSTYAQTSPGVHKGYEYSRTHNPTRTNFERSIASLENGNYGFCLLYTSPSPRDLSTSRMPSSA